MVLETKQNDDYEQAKMAAIFLKKNFPNNTFSDFMQAAYKYAPGNSDMIQFRMFFEVELRRLFELPIQ